MIIFFLTTPVFRQPPVRVVFYCAFLNGYCLQIPWLKWLRNIAETIGSAAVILGILKYVVVPWMVDETYKGMTQDPNVQLQAKQWIIETTQKHLVTDPTVQADVLSATERAYRNVATASYQAYFFLDDTKEYVMPIYVSKGRNDVERDVKLHIILNHYGAGELRKGKILINNEVEVKNFDFSKVDHEQTIVLNLTSAIKEARESALYPDRDQSIFTVSFRPDPTQETDDVISVKALINVMGLSIDDIEDSAELRQ